MRRLAPVCTCVIALSLAVGSATAQDEFDAGYVDYGAPGVYVFLGGANGIDMAAADTLNQALMPPVPAVVSGSMGFKAKFGSRMHRNFAFETEIEYQPSFETSLMGLTFAKHSALTFTGNVKVYLPIQRFQPFLVLGAGGMYASVEDTIGLGAAESGFGYAIRGGGGAELYITEHIAAAVDVTYVLPGGATVDLDYLSIGWGLQYRF